MNRNFLTEREAATYLCISPKTLARWRCVHKGPRVHKFGGAVRYKLDDLIQFASSCVSDQE